LKSGLKFEKFSDGYFVIYYENGDVKQVYPDLKTVYYYSESKIT
jgi:hypothetical protein